LDGKADGFLEGSEVGVNVGSVDGTAEGDRLGAMGEIVIKTVGARVGR